MCPKLDILPTSSDYLCHYDIIFQALCETSGGVYYSQIGSFHPRIGVTIEQIENHQFDIGVYITTVGFF